ncbi:hypothetical protein Ocin01_15954, partial [Orchesella cincta]
MDALKRKRGVEKGNITKAVTWINSIDKDLVTVIFLKNKRELVQGYFVKFEETQGQIEDLCADEAELMTQLPEREEFENSESSHGLQQLLDTTKECLRTLTVLGRPVEHWDDVIVHFILERMDPETPENTIFGWVLLGRVATKGQESVRNHHVHCAVDELLMKVWETEELRQSRQLTPLEQQAEDHYRSTHSRDDDGRYVVHVPFNSSIDKLGSSREAAVCRWKQVER